MTDTPAISIQGVSKRFGRVLALDDLSLDIRQNELFAILGPNGAGKSTLMMAICTLLRPDSGSISLAGTDVLRKPRQARRSLGVVFQDPSLDTRLSVWENLDFHGRVYGVPGRLRRQRIDDLLEHAGLADTRDRIVRGLSTGMKRRVEIIRAMIHDSSVIILDEPTVGLDPQSRARLWDYLAQVQRDKKVTLVVTTHYIDEVEHCDRACIIDHGRLLALGTPADLKMTYGMRSLRLTARDAPTAAEILATYPQAVQSPDGEIVLTLTEEATEDGVLEVFGTRLRRFAVETSSLEGVFLSLTGRDIRETSGPGTSGERRRGQEPRM